MYVNKVNNKSNIDQLVNGIQDIFIEKKKKIEKKNKRISKENVA